MKFFQLAKAREVYRNGGNVTAFLRACYGGNENTGEIIEVAYDLQAGTYIENVNKNISSARAYASELAGHLSANLATGMSLLDVGTGELTTLSLIMSESKLKPARVLAFDISWSRVSKGLAFWKSFSQSPGIDLHAFVADIKNIPLHSKSVDVITSSHALEPNGGNLINLLQELFRVCRYRLVLFEPSYEHNSEEGKRRMESMGYIKGIEQAVAHLGGEVISVTPIKNISNSLNPTYCYVISPSNPLKNRFLKNNDNFDFTIPGTDLSLIGSEGFMVSPQTGLVFPVLRGVPLLKESNSILATSFFNE